MIQIYVADAPLPAPAQPYTRTSSTNTRNSEYHSQVLEIVRAAHATIKTWPQKWYVDTQGKDLTRKSRKQDIPWANAATSGREIVKREIKEEHMTIEWSQLDSCLFENCTAEKRNLVIKMPPESRADQNGEPLSRKRPRQEEHTKRIELAGNTYGQFANPELVAEVVIGVPPHSAFCNSDYTAWTKQHMSTPFSVISIDPPFPNVSVKRASTYATMDLKELDKVDLLLADAGKMLIWTTNAYDHIQFTMQYLKERGLYLQTRLIWVKVSINGDPVHPWDNYSRRPYEICFIAARDPASELQDCVYFAPAYGHSRKPDLTEWILRQGWEQGHMAEVFARDVKQGWHAFGNEVLKYNIV